MGTIASEISMRFGFRGYSHVVTAGCTSSPDIGYAYQHIQAGVQPMFIGRRRRFADYSRHHQGLRSAASAHQSWKALLRISLRGRFPPHRDGFVIAEGSWMFILEDYVHARARGARIYAEFTGYASTCEAFHRVRMSDSPEEPARAITMALEEAGIAAGDVHC